VSALDLLHLAKTAAARAGEYLRGVRRPADPAGWTLKGSRDFVTEVDRTAARMITEILQAGAPEGRLDGTTNFLHDFPSYAVSIAAAIDGVLEAGVVLHVPRNETYSAARGGGSWLGQRQLCVSAIVDPEFALIGTGFPFQDVSRLEEYQRQFGRVARGTSGIRRPGAAALDLADVAAGRFDGFWEQRLSAWDIAAGSLLIREAGGIITDLSGRDIGIEHTGVVAGNPSMHGWLIDTLKTDQ
jgi:myo-inositol-1(or 4)-monophosphatase